MHDYIEIIRKIENDFDDSKINLPIDQTGIDSLGLVSVRIEIERYIGDEISDEHWYSFNTINDIIEHCDKINTVTSRNKGNSLKQTIKKSYEINLPQMANNALSENWLFKTLGDTHWKLLFDSLGKKSSLVTDDKGNRLYATFIRIKTKLSPLIKFKENQNFIMEGEISRYGKNNYFTEFNCTADDNTVQAELMTTFARRQGKDNLDLIKSSPKVNPDKISELNQMPPFLTDYRVLKKNLIDEHILDGEKFDLGEKNNFETIYTLNPFYDLNGVGLLYFAAYPTISDFCESIFFNKLKEVNQWEDEYFTTARDIFYYANCNITDKIIYRLNEHEFIAGDKIMIHSSLVRDTDKIPMADIFTIKEKNKT